MNVYIFQADIYCEDCGKDIANCINKDCADLAKHLTKIYPLEKTDSNHYPQGPYPDGGGESDTPQHCGCGKDCLNAITLRNGRKVGCFLENPLTSEGYQYVVDSHAEQPNSEVVEIWREFYGVRK